MFWPWQLISKLFNIKFTYEINLKFDVNKILDEYYIMQEQLKFKNHFGKHHDGGWSAIALYSHDGKSDSLSEKSNVGSKKTEISEYCPYTTNLVEQIKTKFNCETNRVRFMKLKPGKKITWHFDHDESIEFGNARLHLPIIVNNDCSSYICHYSYKFTVGKIWYGDFSFPHEVSNLGNDERIHLVVDLKKPEGLFDENIDFEIEERRRRRLKKIIQNFYKIFYLFPKKIF